MHVWQVSKNAYMTRISEYIYDKNLRMHIQQFKELKKLPMSQFMYMSQKASMIQLIFNLIKYKKINWDKQMRYNIISSFIELDT